MVSFIQRTKSCPSGAGRFQHNSKNKTKQTPAKWSADGSGFSEHGDGNQQTTGAHRAAGAQELGWGPSEPWAPWRGRHLKGEAPLLPLWLLHVGPVVLTPIALLGSSHSQGREREVSRNQSPLSWLDLTLTARL